MYKHPQLNVFLVVYVHDFRMAGSAEYRAQAWKLLRKHIKLSEPELWGRYLGVHSVVRANPDGFRTVRYEMLEYAQQCIDKYVSLTGRSHKFRKYGTPFLDEKSLPLQDFDMTGSLQVMQLPWS